MKLADLQSLMRKITESSVEPVMDENGELVYILTPDGILTTEQALKFMADKQAAEIASETPKAPSNKKEARL
jgi:hypothetical protein